MAYTPRNVLAIDPAYSNKRGIAEIVKDGFLTAYTSKRNIR